jgi:hypothetical protein
MPADNALDFIDLSPRPLRILIGSSGEPGCGSLRFRPLSTGARTNPPQVDRHRAIGYQLATGWAQRFEELVHAARALSHSDTHKHKH